MENLNITIENKEEPKTSDNLNKNEKNQTRISGNPSISRMQILLIVVLALLLVIVLICIKLVYDMNNQVFNMIYNSIG